jgi:hypothetical protein
MLSRAAASAGELGSSIAVWAVEARALRVGVVALEQQHLVGLHRRVVEPPVVRSKGERVDLADAVAVAQIGRDEVRLLERARVAERERRLLDRAAQRTPDVDHREASLQQLFGLDTADQIAHPLRAGTQRVVVVDVVHRALRLLLHLHVAVGVADVVVEHQHALRPREGSNERLHLRVVVSHDRLRVVRVGERRRELDERETLDVERWMGEFSRIAYDDTPAFAVGISPGNARRRRVVCVVVGTLSHRCEIVERGLHHA